MLTVDEIRDGRAFEALEGEWRELLSTSDADPLFMSWEWSYSWWNHFGAGRALRLVAVRDGARLVALAPLVVRGRAFRRLQPFESLEFLGTGTAGSDYLDLVVRRGHEAGALDALHRHFDAAGTTLELSHTAAAGTMAAQLAQRLAGDGWAHVVETIETCPVIELTGHDWDSYLETLGASHRYNVRRRFRKLDKSFDARFECARDDAERARFLADLVRLHHLRRETLGGSDGLDGDAAIAFHDAVTKRAQAQGWLRLYRLSLDGVAVAAVYGFQVAGRFYFYQSGFDPAYGKHSVGLLVLAHSIRAAIEEGASAYDLLHGNEGYKYHWTSVEQSLVRHHLYPPHPKGVVAHRLLGLKQQLKTCRVA